jgi:hypothetical protein
MRDFLLTCRFIYGTPLIDFQKIGGNNMAKLVSLPKEMAKRITAGELASAPADATSVAIDYPVSNTVPVSKTTDGGCFIGDGACSGGATDGYCFIADGGCTAAITPATTDPKAT